MNEILLFNDVEISTIKNLTNNKYDIIKINEESYLIDQNEELLFLVKTETINNKEYIHSLYSNDFYLSEDHLDVIFILYQNNNILFNYKENYDEYVKTILSDGDEEKAYIIYIKNMIDFNFDTFGKKEINKKIEDVYNKYNKNLEPEIIKIDTTSIDYTGTIFEFF